MRILNLLRRTLAASPTLSRVLPFAVFGILTLVQDQFGPAARFWIYLVKSIAGAWLVWVTWPIVREMRWNVSWQAVAVGIAMFAIWIGLDGLWRGFFAASRIRDWCVGPDAWATR